MFKLGYNGDYETCSFKEVFAETIEQLIREDSDVVYLDADLMNSFGTVQLPEKYPDQAIDCGIQEANMVGVAAGMSAEGKKPYCHSFGTFASRRCYDQVFMSVGYAHTSVRIIGSDPGICAMYNGGTHMPFEDVALYRAIPEAAIYDPCDTVQFKAVLRGTKNRRGVTYIRSQRKYGVKIYDTCDYQLGKANVLCEGKDAVIFAVGIMVGEALKARETLSEQGIDVCVADLVSIKPLDEEAVAHLAARCGAVVTCENSNIRGGVFGAVSECLAACCPVPVEAVGVFDEYGEVGSYDYLKKRYGLTYETVVNSVKRVLERKEGK